MSSSEGPQSSGELVPVGGRFKAKNESRLMWPLSVGTAGHPCTPAYPRLWSALPSQEANSGVKEPSGCGIRAESWSAGLAGWARHSYASVSSHWGHDSAHLQVSPLARNSKLGHNVGPRPQALPGMSCQTQ